MYKLKLEAGEARRYITICCMYTSCVPLWPCARSHKVTCKLHVAGACALKKPWWQSKLDSEISMSRCCERMLATARCIVLCSRRDMSSFIMTITISPNETIPCRRRKHVTHQHRISVPRPSPAHRPLNNPLKTLVSILLGEAKSNSPFAIGYLDIPSLLKSAKGDQSAPMVSNSDKVGMSWNFDCPASLSQA